MRRIGTLFFYLLFFLFSSLPQTYSQDISGLWQGILQQGGGQLSLGLDLDQQENEISGTRFIKGGPTAFAIFGIQGTINNASFSYQSNNIINQIRPAGGFWCNLGGTLTYDSTGNTLNGNWCPNNCITGCGGVRLWKLSVVSDTIFCQGETVDLVLDGNNIKWYADEALTTEVNAGNTYTLQLDTTTTFYITQTNEEVESPPYPITFHVSDTSSPSGDCNVDSGQNMDCDLTDCPTIPISLNDWTQEGEPSFGEWNVINEGQTVTQDENGDPTFFVSDQNFFNTSIAGSFKITKKSSDSAGDFVGFVFGFQSAELMPGEYDFLVFDWKEKQQRTTRGGLGQEGKALYKIKGMFEDTDDLAPVFWGKGEDERLEVLATDYGAGKGWRNKIEYQFRLDYFQNNIKVFIDSTLIFDVLGNFLNGKFGFYNFSIDGVEYMSFSEAVECETFYADTDGDGFGDLNNTTIDCVVPEGFVANADDCDDTNPNRNIGETCDPMGLVPFDCSSAFYRVSNGQLQVFDTLSTSYTSIGPDHPNINSIGYNIEDDLIYGQLAGNRSVLVRIDAEGTLEEIGIVEGLPNNTFSGDFDNQGNLYFLDNINNQLLKVDVDATTLQTENVGIQGNIPILADISFDKENNLFYGVRRDNRNLVKIDLSTLTLSQIPTTITTVDDTGFGASYYTGDRKFYVYENLTFRIYEIDVTSGNSKIVATISNPNQINIDGANCPNALSIFSDDAICNGQLPTQTFTTQAQLDSFTCDCPNNTLTIEGDLIINGDDITDLSNLSCIKTVRGNVHIGDSLTIPSNDILETLDGLGGIMTIGGNLIICNNPMLRSLSDFSSLMEVGGDIQVKNCVVLESIRITVLQSVGGSFIIRGCPFLIEIGPWLLGSLSGGDFIIDGSFRLGSLGGGGNLTFIGGDLFLINTGLPDLTELKNLITLLGCFHIINNEQIIDLRGLSSLQEIGEDVRIKNNEFITNLDSLSSLTTINGSLIIMGNPQLTSLDGLQNLTIVGDTLMVTFNDTLNSCCGINDLLQNNGIGGPIMISANLQGCMSPMDIDTTCTIDCDNLGLNVGAVCVNDDGVEGIVNGVCICVTDTPPVDMDNDGFTDDVDCDDNNPAIYPGATEVLCDGIDSNCNGEEECNQPPCIVGETCDDGNVATINDTVTTECICMGTDTTTVAIDPTFCPEFNAFIGTPCDDNDSNTEDEWLEEGCNCVGKVINGCNAVITVRDNTIIVEGVSGAHIKVHLYDRTFSNAIDTTCDYYNDCEGTQIFSDLLPGVYAVQYQSFNDDWTNIICDSVVYVEVAAPTNETGCEGVDIQVINGALKIDKLPSLNTIIDVYDPSYKSMFNCIGDCGTSQTIENLPVGNYLVRLKVYDVFWNFICEIEERIDIAATIGETTEDRVPAPEITPSIGRFSERLVDKLKVFPNPTAENINVSTNDFVGKNMTITLIDMFGRVVQRHQLDKVTDSIFTININGYDAGVYQIIASSKEQSLTAKMIILR